MAVNYSRPRPEIRPGRRRRRNPGRDGLPDLLLGVVHLQVMSYFGSSFKAKKDNIYLTIGG